MERGGKPIEYCDDAILSVAYNISPLESSNDKLLMFGKVGMQVNIRHPLTANMDRQENGGNKR
ncbi:hypothetical protein A2U01_0043327 [Trifolium medium]|uniref:Uncharacterized protein n=1 Tax=Trifolium medium TaxID=97028 RepID=A0A392QCU3_9FABA|nr:hypothetical protein [Trifolium medium]